MNIKKTLSLILALPTLTLSAVSCAESKSDGASDNETQNSTSESNSETETETETEEKLSDGLGNPNFDGYSFRILSCGYGSSTSNFGAYCMMYPEITGNPVNDTLFESKSYIEDRFNVHYEPIDISSRHDVDTMTRTSINAGDNAFDIVINNDGMTFSLAKEGMFYNMFDVGAV